MSLPSYLASIKSSGIYRFVWDKSEVNDATAEILRLVVGYSEKGPFNTPVYIRNQQEFVKIFGGISKKLEKRGVYFHRLAMQALRVGPILCLNLKKFSYDAKGLYSTVKGMTLNAVKTTPNSVKTLKVEDLYDTTRFWNLDPSHLVDALYTRGHKIMDKYISITAADSKESSRTIFMRGSSNPSYNVTMKEWFSSVTTEEMPSYLEGYEDTMISDYLVKVYVFDGQFTKDVVSTSNLKEYFDFDEEGNIVLKKYIVNAFGEKVDALDALANDDASNFISVYEGVTLPFFRDSKNSYISLDLIFNADYANHKMMMYMNSTLLDDEKITVEDIITTGAGCIDVLSGQLVVKNGMFNIDAPVYPTISYADWSETAEEWIYNEVEADSPRINMFAFKLEDGDTYIPETDEKQACIVSTNYDKWIASGITTGMRVISKPTVDEEGIKSNTKLATVTRIIENKETPKSIEIYFSKNLFGVEDDSTIYIYNYTLGDITANARPIYLTGYTLDAKDVKPESLLQYDKLKWQQNILSTLKEYDGIRQALTNRRDVEYRYLVDTFEAYVEEECHGILVLICKEKDNAFAFINFPATKTFKSCEYSSFTDKDGKFQVKYIIDGCNKQKPASIRFSLVSEANGASYCSYNTPLLFSDGTVKTVVPAAALVSNNFMTKYTSRQPYNIVAGANYGRMIAPGLVGPDINYSRAELDLLEPYGVNAMVFEPRKGTFINSNQTAKQKPETALSKINVRELVIYLQDEIEELLRNYHWEMNTATLRATVKAKADKICEVCQSNGGIYTFFNKCDDENNTPEVIDNEMIILSTSIEPARGSGKMVQELTLYKTGGLSSVIS